MAEASAEGKLTRLAPEDVALLESLQDMRMQLQIGACKRLEGMNMPQMHDAIRQAVECTIVDIGLTVDTLVERALLSNRHATIIAAAVERFMHQDFDRLLKKGNFHHWDEIKRQVEEVQQAINTPEGRRNDYERLAQELSAMNNMVSNKVLSIEGALHALHVGQLQLQADLSSRSETVRTAPEENNASSLAEMNVLKRRLDDTLPYVVRQEELLDILTKLRAEVQEEAQRCAGSEFRMNLATVKEEIQEAATRSAYTTLIGDIRSLQANASNDEQGQPRKANIFLFPKDNIPTSLWIRDELASLERRCISLESKVPDQDDQAGNVGERLTALEISNSRLLHALDRSGKSLDCLQSGELDGTPALKTSGGQLEMWHTEYCEYPTRKDVKSSVGLAVHTPALACANHADTFVQIDTHFEGNGIQSEELDHCIIRQLDDDHVMESTFSQLATGQKGNSAHMETGKHVESPREHIALPELTHSPIGSTLVSNVASPFRPSSARVPSTDAIGQLDAHSKDDCWHLEEFDQCSVGQLDCESSIESPDGRLATVDQGNFTQVETRNQIKSSTGHSASEFPNHVTSPLRPSSVCSIIQAQKERRPCDVQLVQSPKNEWLAASPDVLKRRWHDRQGYVKRLREDLHSVSFIR